MDFFARRLGHPCLVGLFLSHHRLFGPARLPPSRQAPADTTVHAEKTTTEFQLHVTWKAFSGDTSIQLVRNGAPSPPPVVDQNHPSQPPTLGQGWESVTTTIPPGATEFFDSTIFAQSYGVCAFNDDNEATCIGPSARAFPKQPPAAVESMQVFLTATDRLGLQWTQTPDTVFSRASILQGDNVISSVDNDPDQQVIFSNLAANTSFTLKVCVRNVEQTESDQACSTITKSNASPASGRREQRVRRSGRSRSARAQGQLHLRQRAGARGDRSESSG